MNRRTIRNRRPRAADGLASMPGAPWWLKRHPPAEPAVVRKLRHVVRRGWTVADVGARYGRYTKLLSRLVGGAGQVIAFEAHPEIAAELRSRTRTNVTVEQFAVADVSGRPLRLTNGVGSRSWTWSVVANGDARGIPVPSITLDDYFDGPLDFVKIDVEGTEGLVVAGMKRLLDEARPTLLIETHRPDAAAAALDGLRRYRIEVVDDTHLLAVPAVTSPSRRRFEPQVPTMHVERPEQDSNLRPTP